MRLLKNTRGFTLLEIMIAVAILTGMSLLITTTMNRVLTAKVKVEGRDEQLHGLRVALSKMVDDISQAVRANKAFSGSDNKFMTGMKGSDVELNFSTLSHYHFLEGLKETDQTVIGYSLKPTDKGENSLMRRETGRLSDKLDEGGTAYPLLDNVKKLKFSYYDSNKKEWVNEWDSEQISVLGRLPFAVKIELTVIEEVDDDEKRPREYDFSTIALIESYKNELNF